jgi:hypothetical protein
MSFDIVFTPFQITMVIVSLILLHLVYKSIKSKNYKTAIALILAIILFNLYQPFRLTTNTNTVNMDRVINIENERFRNVPDKVVVERLSYKETLDKKSDELRNRD